MNKLIIGIIVFELILCLICSIGSIVWNINKAKSYSYFIEQRTTGFGEGVLTFFTMFILLNTMIPISLIISLDMVKFAQSVFIDNDIDMRVDNEFSKCYNSTINEELGQIEYIFSDKTGTLTCNIMEFVYCIVGENGFGDPALLGEETEIRLKRKTTYTNKKAGVEYSFANKELTSLIMNQIEGKKEDFEFKDDNGKVIYEIKNLQKMVKQFFLNLSVNHECMAEKASSEGEEVNYQGPSPDEVALVDTAKHLGYEFKKSTSTGKLININGTDCEIEVLQIFEFSS